MRILGHLLKGGMGGAVIGYVFSFIAFYLLTSTFRDDFYISAVSYAIIGFCIGSIYSFNSFLLLDKYKLLNTYKVLHHSIIGLISAVLGCLPFIALFLYENSQKQKMIKAGTELLNITLNGCMTFFIYCRDYNLFYYCCLSCRGYQKTLNFTRKEGHPLR